MDVQVNPQVGTVEFDAGTTAKLLSLLIDDGIFDLEGAEMAMIEGAIFAGTVHGQAVLGS